MRKIAELVLLLACGSAQAADWVSLTKSADGLSEHFVDISSIRIAGAVRSVWTKQVFAPHTTRGVAEDAKKRESYQLMHLVFNCSEETWRGESATVYFDDGTNWSDLNGIYRTTWQSTPPDTVLSVQMKAVCAWKPK
jgi:hypothetical protein